jgi:adenylosuccinate synthase
MAGKLGILVGGSYGSEGKGVVAAHIAEEYDWAVRSGGPNAGHSFKYQGDKIVMQSIPCNWINMDSQLAIAAGGMVEPEKLFEEIEIISQYDPGIEERLYIDPQAVVLDETAQNAEGGVGGSMHENIGSTGEGCGAVRIMKIARQQNLFGIPPATLARDCDDLKPFLSTDPVSLLVNEALGDNRNVLLEGTQGSGLSLHHGPWPKCTSADTNAAQLLADVGIGPRAVTDVIVVFRTFPIRVAGNSGPMFNELTWEDISERLGRPVEERTTVTKKVRRIGDWDDSLFIQSIQLNTPTQIALTFVDYLAPEDEGKTSWDDLSHTTKSFVERIERMSNVPVTLLGTGGPDWAIVDRR